MSVAMTSRRTIINLVFFSLVGLVFFAWAATNLVKLDSVRKPYQMKADFSSTVGLLPGSEVDYQGVTYGAVTKVERIPGGARVTMKLDHGKLVPDGASADIFRKSALGEQYILFQPPEGYGGHGGPYYKPKTIIPMTHTTVPLEFSELLRSASKLIGAIPPEAVGSLLHEAAVGLDGRTDSLRQLTGAGDRLSQALVQRTAALDRLATNNTRLTHVFTEHRNSFGQSLSDLRQIADSLKNARGDTTVLLQRGTQLLSELDQVISSRKGELDCTLKNLELVTDVTTTQHNLQGLATLLDIGPQGFQNVWDASEILTGPDGSTGRWVRVGFLAPNMYNPAPQFTPPKELPPVQSVPGCSSPLQPSGNYRPAAATRPVPLPLGAGLVGAIVLVGVFGGMVVRRTRRGVPSLG